MAKILKPTAGNAVGLDANYTKLGTSIANARVHVIPSVESQGLCRFQAWTFWNKSAYDAWVLDGSVNPLLQWSYEVQLDPDSEKSIRLQCLEHLLLQPEWVNFEVT